MAQKGKELLLRPPNGVVVVHIGEGQIQKPVSAMGALRNISNQLWGEKVCQWIIVWGG